MYKFTSIFESKIKEYNQQFQVKVEVDWEKYKKFTSNSKEKPPAAIHIYTNNFIIKSIHIQDLDEFHPNLWGDPEVMKLYHIGKPRSFEQTKKRLQEFTKYWESGNPFSGYIVHDYDNNLIGGLLLVLEEGNFAQLSYFSAARYHGRGYSKEYIGAVVYHLGKYLIEQNTILPNGKLFKGFYATNYPDNIPSIRVLENLGFTYIEKRERHGSIKDYRIFPIIK